ncbi:MAG: type III-B CRISPR module RAMP protein Cmr1 [Planctomycetes bacterium]|nr:type III-B CRISPR module RAMP protein Cmr1 [Planctomycetota bacterium]
MTPQESPCRSQQKAPKYQELPTAKPRAARGGPELVELHVQLEVVTPILGGCHQTRAIDDVDVIRAPSVRGHLRFWWRALYAAQYANAEALYQRESALWGRAATDDGGRSAVEIRVRVERVGNMDRSEIRLYPSQGQQATPGAYALWPARGETRMNTPTAPRRQPGTQFQLTLRVAGSGTDEAEVRNALRAWVLFGGYGGRSRRGLGTLSVIGNVNGWLPTAATREALTSFFGLDVFKAPTRTPGDVPWLGGAAIHVGRADRNAQTAWTTALGWLREFRQGPERYPSAPSAQGTHAREPGTGKAQANRPSISNWPEADKIRHIKNKTGSHPPRHNATAAWPRAGFGLPIIGQFQSKGRNNEHYDEPGSFELRWRAGNVEHDRLASPLIVKALPLADGTFTSCALWLRRSLPNDAQTGLARPKHGRPNEKEVDPGTVAPFDRLVANGETPQFSALANKTGLRQAFLDWLLATKQTTVVAP